MGERRRYGATAVARDRDCEQSRDVEKAQLAASHHHHHHQHHVLGCCRAPVVRAAPSSSSSVVARGRGLALGVGVVHGLTHVVWVLPVLQMRDLASAATYLAAFCLTSTAMMGLFAAAFGELTRRASSTNASPRLFVVVFWRIFQAQPFSPKEST